MLSKPKAAGVGRVAGVSVVCLVSALAATRQQAPQSPPTFRTSTNLVVVDASVLDGARNPVRGLTAADFTVLEDGRPQPIVTFSEIRVSDLAPTTASWSRDVAPDVQDNLVQGDRRVLVIVLDDATPMNGGDGLRVRTVAREVVERLGPRDLAAVVYVLNKRKGQDFTNDKQRLLEALNYFNPGIPTPRVKASIGMQPGVSPLEDSAWYAFDPMAVTMYHATLSALEGVITDLGELAGRRKAVVFVSVGLPLGDVGDDGISAPPSEGELFTRTLDIYRAAQRANVNIYALDPGGLRVTVAPRNRDYLLGLAENTGGLAILNTNDPVPGISQMIRESGSYYLLAYQAPNPQSTGRYRRIDIRVNRPGVTVRARRGYQEQRASEPRNSATAARPTPSPAWRSLAAVLPRTDLGLRVTAAPFAVPGQSSARVAVVTRVELPVPAAAEPTVDEVKVLVSPNRAGVVDPRGPLETAIQIERPAGAEHSMTYEVLAPLDLKPGSYQLRVGVSSALLEASGSVYYDVDVPDFTKGTLAVSGLVISATPGTRSGPKDRLASLIPVVPTTQRDFSADQGVTAFLRVYQPGRRPLVSVRVRAQVLDGRSAEMFTREESLEAARFGNGRSADYTLQLPLAELAKGEYLLTVEATANEAGANSGATGRIRRDVRFSVR